MRKVFRIFGVTLILMFLIIQFIRPAKNISDETPDHIFSQVAVPGDVQEILKNACLDCHSNQTQYQWYHEVAPVSWLVADHVKEGKKELNFSEWGKLSSLDQMSLLIDIIDETKAGKMPLKSYSLIHSKAKLDKEQIKTLNTWAESYGMELFRKK